MNVKRSLLGRRAAILASVGAVAVAGIGFASVARAQQFGQVEKQVLQRPDLRADRQLPRELNPLATALERRSSFEKEIKPPYGLRFCCPPMSLDLLLNLFVDAPRPTWMSPYALQWSTVGTGSYQALMNAYATYLGALYGGTAKIYTVLYVTSGEKKCQGKYEGLLWQATGGGPFSGYSSGANLQVNTDYYIHAEHFAQIAVGKETFWIKLNCDSPCAKFSIRGGLAKVIGGDDPTATFIRSGLDGAKVIETNPKGAVIRDTTGKIPSGGDSRMEPSPEASAEAQCVPCAQ